MKISIKNKILIPTLSLMIIGLGCLAIVSYTKSKTALQKVINSQIIQIEKSTAAMMKSWISDRKLDVKTWSLDKTYRSAFKDSFVGKSARKASSEKLAGLVKEYGYYENIAIADEKGDLIASADPSHIGKVNVLTREYFKAAMKGDYTMGKMVKSKATGNPVIIFAGPVQEKGATVGILLAVVSLDAFSNQFVDTIKVGEEGYAYLMDTTGMVLAYPDKSQVYKLDFSKFDFGKQMLAEKKGQIEYFFEDVNKVALFRTFENLGCTLVITASSREIFAPVSSMGKINFVVTIVILLAAVVLILFVTASVVKPIGKVVDGLKDAAEGEGDLTKRLEIKSNDEVSSLAKWFNIFVEKLQGIISDIAGNSEKLSSASSRLLDLSKSMSDGAEQMSTKTNSVAAAAEEMSSNMASVAAAAEQSSSNINMVSSAAEEMTSTINEIATNTDKTRNSSNQAVDKTKDASENINQLSKDAQQIGRVVETITDISEQTNLLALNATIEAARAGEAGKGFAVVANEIKDLARQTAEATLEIKQKIDGIQGSTQQTVSTIGEIIEKIDDVNQMIDTVAAAVEEQSLTTKEIASNVTQAALGIQEVTENVSQSSTVANEISQDIAEVSLAADEMSNNSSQVNTNAGDLNQLSVELKKTVSQFKI